MPRNRSFANEYPQTNGGKYRFNPNLYAVTTAVFVPQCHAAETDNPFQDGKVCLSLLGTWQGPGWVAGRSTLLQVSHLCLSQVSHS